MILNPFDYDLSFVYDPRIKAPKLREKVMCHLLLEISSPAH